MQQIEVVGMTELDIANEIIQKTIRETAEEETITDSSITMVANCLIFDGVEFCLDNIIKEAMDLVIIR